MELLNVDLWTHYLKKSVMLLFAHQNCYLVFTELLLERPVDILA